MKTLKRIYDGMLEVHLENHRQMAFFSGPRQVGKTTTCRNHAGHYFNWDDPEDRAVILAGSAAIAGKTGMDRLLDTAPVVLFDEMHKYPRWKNLLKGLFDKYGDRLRIIATGSSRMDVFRRGGDSLMGRYFPYRMHPFSVAETITSALPGQDSVVRPPSKPDPVEFEALIEFGGYPEPFLKRDVRFSRRWQALRMEQFVRGEVRDLAQIQQLAQLETMVRLLAGRSGRQLSYAGLAREVQISVDTAKRWIEVLRALHFGFLVRPWFKNVARTLRKEPKWFLRDWALVDDPGGRSETFLGCHLLKAVEGWTDLGLGRFDLCYLRDKEKREVDFVVVREGKPWMLVEAKHGDAALNPSLEYFQGALGAPFAFQVAVEADFVRADCFEAPRGPLKVPARTFLSQLL